VTEFETLHKFEGLTYDLTFHPQFAENGYIFVGWNGPLGGYYAKGDSRVSRFTMDRQAPYKFDSSSELRIIEWSSHGHDGAAVAFGKDHMLYVTSGDGTSDSDEHIVGQDMSRLTSKVLRIDVDHLTDADRKAGRITRYRETIRLSILRGLGPKLGLRTAQPVANDGGFAVGSSVGYTERARPVGTGLSRAARRKLWLERYRRGTPLLSRTQARANADRSADRRNTRTPRRGP